MATEFGNEQMLLLVLGFLYEQQVVGAISQEEAERVFVSVGDGAERGFAVTLHALCEKDEIAVTASGVWLKDPGLRRLRSVEVPSRDALLARFAGTHATAAVRVGS